MGISTEEFLQLVRWSYCNRQVRTYRDWGIFEGIDKIIGVHNDVKYVLVDLAEDLYTEIKWNKIEKDSLEEENEKLKKETAALKLENEKALKEIEVYKKTLSKMNGHYAQMELLHNGKKIAYKEKASPKNVEALVNKGYTKTEIAEILGVSRYTIYRRIKEIEEAL